MSSTPSLQLPSPFHLHRGPLVPYPLSWIPLLGLRRGQCPFLQAPNSSPQKPELEGKLAWLPRGRPSFCTTRHLNSSSWFTLLLSLTLHPRPPTAAFSLCGVSTLSTKLCNMTATCPTLLRTENTEESKTHNSACLLELYSSERWQPPSQQIPSGLGLSGEAC